MAGCAPISSNRPSSPRRINPVKLLLRSVLAHRREVALSQGGIHRAVRSSHEPEERLPVSTSHWRVAKCLCHKYRILRFDAPSLQARQFILFITHNNKIIQ